MDNVVRHLEMVQNIISRMASNSFMLKGWAVTLIAGIFALSAKDSNPWFFLLAYIPIITFWGLDGYYLKLEREFRSLYDYVRKQDETDFNMKLKEELKNEKHNWTNCLLSHTEIWFYFPVAVLTAIVVILAFVVLK